MNTSKHRFYVDIDRISGTSVVFPDQEVRHMTRVLRLVEGNQVTVIDGRGNTYLVELVTIGKKNVLGTIKETRVNVGEPEFGLHIALALLKQSARWETFLEKAVESGCTRITPLITARTEAKKFNRRRAQSIMENALKQCERSIMPVLDDPLPLPRVVSLMGSVRLICHEGATQGTRLGQVLEGAKTLIASPAEILAGHPSPIRILVGPEGGFSPEEVESAISEGWKSVWLGNRRLRAETAAISVAAIVSQFVDERLTDD